MKYLCLGYFNPEKMSVLPEAELDAVMSECSPHLREFYQSGRVLFDAGLEETVKSMKRTGGNVTVTDGPFAESKEMIGSAFVIEADTFEEALHIASLHPTTRVPAGEEFGWRLEIRPIHHFHQPE
ncbi:YciI family protein [Tumebacillus sp. BK434]|uniref:YciI family protein n=1 Tax=Tumebacillus sp. BK434 TaxID=2512169 RepID=UPI00104FFD6A|nr:YciI family protein [Tumebacillus sp. BK434]